MTRFARVENGVVVEVIEANQPIDELYHPDIAATFVEASDSVEPGWQFDNEAFLPPKAMGLDVLQAGKIAMLTAACAAEIVAGYTSSALGSPHTYPSNSTDQINMMGSVTDSLLPGIATDWSTPFWCEDADGVWAFRSHSAPQIQTAGADGKAHVVTCQSTLEQLTATVIAATTVEAVAAINWPSA